MGWFPFRGAANDPARAFEAAERHTENGDLTRAAAKYEKAAASGDPEIGPHASFRLGLVRKRMGDRYGAMAALRETVAGGHRDYAPLAAFSLGALLPTEDGHAAAAYLQAADSGHPEAAPMAMLCLGELREEEGRFEEAMAWYRRAADSRHDEVGPKALFSLGVALRKVGETEEGDAMLERARDSGHPVVASMARAELGQANAAPGSAITILNPDLAAQIAENGGMLEALLYAEGLTDLIGRGYTMSKQSDGSHRITFY